MSYRQKETFGHNLNRLSNPDLRRVVDWLTETTGVSHHIVNESECDIRSFEGKSYEHKADQQAHETGNVCIEVFDGRGRKKWLFYCEADYLLVTSQEFLRIYRWRGALQEFILENLEVLTLQYKKPGGDDDVMELLLIPAWRIKNFLELEVPWDNSKS